VRCDFSRFPAFGIGATPSETNPDDQQKTALGGLLAAIRFIQVTFV
jgi:hypothetical protein